MEIILVVYDRLFTPPAVTSCITLRPRPKLLLPIKPSGILKFALRTFVLIFVKGSHCILKLVKKPKSSAPVATEPALYIIGDWYHMLIDLSCCATLTNVIKVKRVIKIFFIFYLNKVTSPSIESETPSIRRYSSI